MSTPSRPILWFRRAALGLVLLVVRSLPPEAARGLFRGLGRAWAHLSPRRRGIAEDNLRVAFGPQRPASEVREIARDAFAHLGAVAAEVILADRIFAPGGAARRRFRYRGDWEGVRALAASGGAGLFLTGHLGNWEAAAWAVRAQGLPLQSVVRTLDDPVLDAFVTGRRGGGGAVIRKWGAVRGALRAVRSGAWVAFLGDQNAGRHGTYVPFFGLEASTFPFPGVLAGRLQVPVWAGYAIATGRGRYDVYVEQLHAEPNSSPDKFLESFHARLEAWIREVPGQYNWTHRRWRSRPLVEPGNPILPRYATRDGRPVTP